MLAPASLRRNLLIAVAVVAAVGLASELAHLYAPGYVVDAVLPKLSLSYEDNVPTWFSSSLLLACALAAGAIALARPPWHRHWWVIAGVATWLSLDEAAEIHEHLGNTFHLSGPLYFDWVIPAAVIVVVLVIAFVPFIRALEPRTRTRLIVAGVVYVTGALLMELPLGWWTERHGIDGLGYVMIDWVEETMEMIGATLAVVALVTHRQDAT